MDAEVRETAKRVGKLTGRKRTSFIAVGNITVLTVNAAKGTAGEKDRTGAAGAGDRRLLPKMRGDAGDEHFAAETAETGMRGAVSAAPARAKITFHRLQMTPSDRYASDRHIMNRRGSRVNRQARMGKMDKKGGLDYNILSQTLHGEGG